MLFRLFAFRSCAPLSEVRHTTSANVAYPLESIA